MHVKLLLATANCNSREKVVFPSPGKPQTDITYDSLSTDSFSKNEEELNDKQKPEVQNYCTFCGSIVKEEDRFCKSCGILIHEEQPQNHNAYVG